LPTGAIIVIVSGERRTMLTEKGANAKLTPDAVTDRLLTGAAILHFTGYSVFSQSHQASLRNLVQRATTLGVRISVDPASSGFIADFGVDRFLESVSVPTCSSPISRRVECSPGLTTRFTLRSGSATASMSSHSPSTRPVSS